MLAFLRSLRNSGKLILPSLSMSASSSSGSMDPFIPVCCAQNVTGHVIFNSYNDAEGSKEREIER